MRGLRIPLAVAALTLLALPFLAPPYALHVAIVVLLNVTYTAALYAVLRMGYLSLGHAGFIALGAYTCVILSVRLGVSPWLGIPAGGLVAGLFAWGLGALTLKLRGIYFSLAIFAFGEIVTAFFRAFDWFGGPAGIPGVPRPAFFGIPLASHFSFYWLVLGVTLACTAVLYRLQYTRFGATLLTLKTADTERLAESVGIAAARYKTAAFVVACVVAGITGAVHAQYLMFVNPQVFTFLTSTDLLIYAMVGGLSSFWGPVLGAGLLTALGEQLFSAGYWKTLVYAAILMAVILLLPGGIVDLPRRLRALRKGAPAAAVEAP
jgi:branched-chain amino acid transport system permease protein